MDDKQKAKLIVLEIIRQAGGVLTNKTNLYKAFYHAHLQYAKENPGVLSLWPIVRMPNGPGIHNFDQLMGELVAEGKLQIRGVKLGSKKAFRFALTDPVNQEAGISPEERNAINYGVKAVRGKTASRVSDDSHNKSQTWHDTKNGDELPIYADLLTADEYEAAKSLAQRAADALRNIA